MVTKRKFEKKEAPKKPEAPAVDPAQQALAAAQQAVQQAIGGMMMAAERYSLAQANLRLVASQMPQAAPAKGDQS